MEKVKKDEAIEAVMKMAVELSEAVKEVAIAVEESTEVLCYRDLVMAAMGAFTGAIAAAAGHSSMSKETFEYNLREILEHCMEDAEASFDINRFAHMIMCKGKVNETTDETTDETIH